MGLLRPAREVAAQPDLTPSEVSEVLALVEATGDADGTQPLSEHVLLHIRHGLPALHLTIRDGHGLLGYAYLDTGDPVEGATAELCVHPLHRRRGLGRALVTRALAEAAARDPLGRLQLWAHGNHPSATALALSLDFDRARVLWQMRRSLLAPIPDHPLPACVALRPFEPGRDDAAWLAVNARAFADLPDQGRWTAADLAARLAEDWFDPAGFLLAERADGVLLGFHWTKVHGAGAAPDHHHDPIGEVYVLGVDPLGQGLGLGTSLTLAGLRYLRERGLDQVMLYVDESNAHAARLYQHLGFAPWATDVCFRHRGSASPAT